MGERLSFHPITARDWLQGRIQINNFLQLMTRMMNDIGSGPNIPSGRLVQGTKIDGIETGADVTADHEAATIVSQGALATKDQVDTAEIVNSAVEKEKISVASIDDIAAALGTQTSGTLESGVALDATHRKIYDTDIVTKCTSFTLSGLEGDTEKEYRCDYRWIDDDAEASFGIRPNNDSGATNYGWEDVYITGSGVSAVCYQDTTFSYIYAGRATPGHLSQGYTRIWAPSGYVRASFGVYTRSVNGTTILGLYLLSTSWNNSADEITSLVFFADQTEEIAPGTHLEVWHRRD